jgi:hypothetical protein
MVEHAVTPIENSMSDVVAELYLRFTGVNADPPVMPLVLVSYNLNLTFPALTLIADGLK